MIAQLIREGKPVCWQVRGAAGNRRFRATKSDVGFNTRHYEPSGPYWFACSGRQSLTLATPYVSYWSPTVILDVLYKAGCVCTVPDVSPFVSLVLPSCRTY